MNKISKFWQKNSLKTLCSNCKGITIADLMNNYIFLDISENLKKIIIKSEGKWKHLLEYPIIFYLLKLNLQK
jgi:hypothetical protein